MKKALLTISISLTLALAGQNGYQYGKERAGNGNSNQAQFETLHSIVLNSEIYELTSEQIEDIKFIYEEEKLARDVYLNLYDKYSLQIFSNIANSEEQHIDSVGSLIEKYSINFSLSEERGVFSNSELTSLYNTLMEKGNLSLNDAIEVGKMIEVTDIEDLVAFIDRASPDAGLIYQNLKSGSENHLSAFESQLNGDSVDSANIPNFSNQSRIVKKGWNIIAYPYENYDSIASFLPKNTNSGKVYRYRNSSWVVSTLTLKDDNLTESFDNEEAGTLPFEGFWIYSPEDFVLNY